MSGRARTFLVGAALAGALSLAERPAVAAGYGVELAALGLVLAPSEVGVELTSTEQGDRAAPVVAWAYKLPLPLRALHPMSAHRLAFALEWAPGGAGTDVRGRVGYRYVWDLIEVGLGAVSGPDFPRLSPELGLRLWRGRELGGLHLRAHVDVAPDAPEDLRAGFTAGWTLL
jgi:hypothetical protein